MANIPHLTREPPDRSCRWRADGALHPPRIVPNGLATTDMGRLAFPVGNPVKNMKKNTKRRRALAQLKAGDLAPDFTVQNDRGETVHLGDFRGKRVILYFYPKDNTPGCTTQACNFRDSYLAITGKNAVVLGVSPDSAKSHGNFKSKYSLPFPLLVDSDHALSEAYGVWQTKKMMGREYMGVVRSHFVIDENGRLADAQYNVKAPESAAKALKTLG